MYNPKNSPMCVISWTFMNMKSIGDRMYLECPSYVYKHDQLVHRDFFHELVVVDYPRRFSNMRVTR